MMSNWFGICSRIQRNIGIVNVKNEKKHIRIIRNVNFFGKYPLSNIQKITCIILRNLFGLDLFSHQSCATGTLLLQKKIYPRKSSLNLKQLIFFMFLSRNSVLKIRLFGRKGRQNCSGRVAEGLCRRVRYAILSMPAERYVAEVELQTLTQYGSTINQICGFDIVAKQQNSKTT